MSRFNIMKYAAFRSMLRLGIALAAVPVTTAKTRTIGSSGPLLCQIVHARELGVVKHRGYQMCDLIAEQGGVMAFGLSIDLPQALVDQHEQALNRGDWFVNITGAMVNEQYFESHGWIRTRVNLPSGSAVTTVAPEIGKMALHSVKNVSETVGRRHLQTRGTHTVLVLRVSVSDSTPSLSSSELASAFFGKGFSVATRFGACSFGAIRFKPYDSSQPVVDVIVKGKAASFTSSNLWPLAMSVGASQKHVSSLTNLAQHVAIIIPPGLSDSNKWVAIGSVGGWWSIFNDKMSNYANFGVHEFSHNLGLGHSGVGSDTYADTSGVMGYGDLQPPGLAKCFNGYHFWYLNWFSSRSITVKPYTPRVLVLAAFAHFDRTGVNQHVVINVDSYYLLYNRAIGINAGVDDVPNKVTVTQSRPNVFSTRVAALDHKSDIFQIANYAGGSKPLIIKVCALVTGGALDYALVSVGVGKQVCNVGT